MKATVRKTHVKQSKQLFPVIVQEDVKGGYWVSCPSLEGCYSQGETVDEALQNVKEAIALCLEDLPKTRAARSPSDVSLHFIQV